MSSRKISIISYDMNMQNLNPILLIKMKNFLKTIICNLYTFT